MVSMFLHRRDVLSYHEEPAPAGPLYPFPTIEDGPLAGTGGQRIVYYNTDGKYVGVYNNKTAGTANSAIRSSVEVFSIPAGASYVLTAEVTTLVAGVGLGRAGFFARNSGTTQAIALVLPNGGSITQPGTYTITGVAETDLSIGEFGFNLTKTDPACELDMTITFTVNGVRYI